MKQPWISESTGNFKRPFYFQNLRNTSDKTENNLRMHKDASAASGMSDDCGRTALHGTHLMKDRT
jgi:hypothetical protein